MNLDPDARQLVTRVTIRDLIGVYVQAERDIRTAFSLIDRARDRLNETLQCRDSEKIRVHDRYGRVNFDRPEESLRETRRDVWSILIERLELRRIMSIRAWEELERQIRNEEPPEIDQESIEQMLRHFEGQIPNLLREAVGEVFEWLRPRGKQQYKTNSQFEIPPRVILGRVVELGCYGYRPSYSYEPRLTALENVFTSLDGKGQVCENENVREERWKLTELGQIPKTGPVILRRQREKRTKKWNRNQVSDASCITTLTEPQAVSTCQSHGRPWLPKCTLTRAFHCAS